MDTGRDDALRGTGRRFFLRANLFQERLDVISDVVRTSLCIGYEGIPRAAGITGHFRFEEPLDEPAGFIG